jgi:diguanylate cyclase (GGDEF)-like protein
VAVFDISGLKAVNERKGFDAGDALLRQGCDIICDLFKHSPVYRMGGNVFAVVTRGRDYDNLEALMAALEATNSAEAEQDGAVVLGGCSRYNGDDDVAVVFRRADDALRQRKRQWKQS